MKLNCDVVIQNMNNPHMDKKQNQETKPYKQVTLALFRPHLEDDDLAKKSNNEKINP
jgi:hypothetical protein